MKVLLINKFLYPKGGDAICTLAMGELLRSKGHEVTYWGMDHPENPEYPYKDLFVSHMDYEGAGGGGALKAAANILYSFEAKKKIAELLKHIRPDIVHLHNFAHQISPSILDVLRREWIPCVMTMHDYKLVCAAYTLLSHGKVCERCSGGRYYQCFSQGCVKDSKAKSLINTIEMYLHHSILHIYDSINTFISPSAFLKNKLAEMGFKKPIMHVPNFVYASDFVPAYDGEKRTIVYFGRLAKEKGISTLIDAIKGLDVRLKIIGEGPIGKEVKAKVEVEKINNVEFLGYRMGKELQNEIRNAMFVVIPSEWYENNPLSILESFALGKPVIGSRIGGIPELVESPAHARADETLQTALSLGVKDGETGLLFEPGNVADLRAKIEYLLANPDKAIEMGRNARKLVEEEYNAEKHYSRLMEIYEQAISLGHR